MTGTRGWVMPNDDVISEQPLTWVLKTEEWRILDYGWWRKEGVEQKIQDGLYLLIFFCLMFIDFFLQGGYSRFFRKQSQPLFIDLELCFDNHPTYSPSASSIWILWCCTIWAVRHDNISSGQVFTKLWDWLKSRHERE